MSGRAPQRNPGAWYALRTVMRTPIRRTSLLFLMALAACAAMPAAGHASATQSMVFEAPNQLLYDQTRPGALDEIQAFGVSHVRQLVYWQSFAPKPNAKHEPSFDASNSAAYPAGTFDR